MFLKYSLFVLILTFSAKISAQKLEVKRLISLAETVLYKTGDIDSCSVYLEHANSLLAQTLLPEEKFQVSLIEAQILARKNEIDSSIHLMERLLLTTSVQPSNTLKGKFYLNLGFNYFLKNETVKALDYYTRSLKYFEEDNDQNNMAIVYCKVAGLYSAELQYERAIAYITKARLIAEKSTDPFTRTSVYSSITGRFLHVGSKYPEYLDSTIYYGKIAVHEIQKNGYLTFAAHICNSVSSALLLQGKEDESFYYLKLATSYSSKLHLGESIITYFNLCDFYLNTERYDQAQVYLDTVYSLANQLNDSFFFRLAHERQYLISKSLNQPEKALDAYEKFIAIQESMYSVEKSSSLNEISEKYESELKDIQIQNLEQKNSLNNLQIILLVVSIVAITSVLLILILLFLRRSQNQKRTLLETEMRLNRLRMNPHFFFNLLSSVQSLAYSPSQKEQVPLYIAKLSKMMRKSLESSYSDLIFLQEEIDFVKEYCSILKVYTHVNFKLEIEIDDDMLNEGYLIPSMIIQPFIENSIEHGFKELSTEGLIKIKFQKIDDKLIVMITDNGIWKKNSKSDNHISRATQITNDRIKLLSLKFNTKTEFEIKRDSNNQYTIVQISLPLLTEDESTRNR